MRTTSAMLSILAVLVAVLIPASPLIAADFSADIVHKENDEIVHGRFFQSGERYRMELKQDGEDISVIVDPGTGTTHVLVHSQKIFVTMKSSGMQSVMNNAFEAYKLSRELYESREAGTESIAGYKCDKIEVSGQGTLMMTAWVSRELGMPLKIVAVAVADREVELANIEEGPVDASLFEIPSGYKDMTPPDAPTQGDAAEPVEQKEEAELSVDTAAAEAAIFEALAEKGVERTTESGTIRLKRKANPILKSYFPDWTFYSVSRALEVDGGTAFSYLQYNTIAYGGEDAAVVFLSAPGTDMPLENGLVIIQDAGIGLGSEEDARALASVLDALYDDSQVESVEPLEGNRWAICTGDFFDNRKGFIVQLGDGGKVVGLSYTLNIDGQ